MTEMTDKMKEKFGDDFYEVIGRKGGLRNKANGVDFVALGSRGGTQTKVNQPPDYFSRIARLPRKKKK